MLTYAVARTDIYARARPSALVEVDRNMGAGFVIDSKIKTKRLRGNAGRSRICAMPEGVRCDPAPKLELLPRWFPL